MGNWIIRVKEGNKERTFHNPHDFLKYLDKNKNKKDGNGE